MKIKQHLYDFCQAFVEERILRIEKNIKGIQESLTSETKSSAGDKHEAGRAMLQLDREKLGQQLAEAEKIRHTLFKVPLETNSEIVRLGSLVKTTKTNYYLSISAGEYKGKEQSVFCISAATPIGKLLLGKSVGNVVIFNTDEIEILEIV